MFNKVTKPIKELSRFEEEHENKTGLEGLHLLHADYKWVKKVKSLKQMRTDHQLTSQEMQKTKCVLKIFPMTIGRASMDFGMHLNMRYVELITRI
jgi:hypothetical protein